VKWKDLASRRKFFDNFAVSKQFNPLEAEKWYTVTTTKDLLEAVGHKATIVIFLANII
jgi:hypothetical protein